MNGYFTDNQTKQKAYDRYYNAMARSDFIQGRKLKALIEKESADDAMTDSLAALFEKAMFKSRAYEYDEITKKIRQKAPAVLISENGGVAAPKAKKTKSPKKFTFVPQSTDDDIEMKPAVPLTPSPAKPESNIVTPPRKRTPPKKPSPVKTGQTGNYFEPLTTPPKRGSSRKNFESSEDWKPSVAPNVLSPKSMAEHRARVAAEEADAEAAYSKFFQDYFGTGPVTKEDEESGAAKIDANGDMDKIRGIIGKLSRERMSATVSRKHPIGRKSMKASAKHEIVKTLKTKSFNYLSKEEKAATAEEINKIIIEEVLNETVDSAAKLRKVQDEVVKPQKRKRIPTPDDKTPTDRRDPKVLIASSPSPKRNLMGEFDEAKSDGSDSFNKEIEQETQQSKYYATRRERAAKIIEEAKTVRQVRSKIKREFGKEISKMLAERKGREVNPKKPYEWFNREIRKPRSDESLTNYRSEIAGMLSGIYLVRE